MFYLRKQYTFRNEEGEGDVGGTAVAQEAEQAKPDTVDPEIETRALEMGWTPKDKFKGDPAQWRDAAEFVERGEKLLPIVKAQNKKLERELAELRQTTREMGEYMSKAEQRAYERALADLKAQRKQALSDADGEAFEQADEAIEKLQREAAEKAAKKAEKQDGEDPVYAEWAARNPWLSDKKMEAYANSAAQYLRSTGETASGAEFLDLVAKEVKARFPEKFTNPRREAAPSVESGVAAPRRGGKTFADMPAEARSACERMAKNGFAGDAEAAKKFKDEYVKQYFEGV